VNCPIVNGEVKYEGEALIKGFGPSDEDKKEC